MCKTVWYHLLSPRDRRAVDIGNKINEQMEEGKRKMMFEVGKEYRTRDGSVAQVSANCNDMQVSNAITSKKEVK